MPKIEVISDNQEIPLPVSEVNDIVSNSLNTLQIKDDLIIEIEFTNPDEIKQLNNRYRGIDKPTDVLSFPQSQTPGDKLNILGTIVIAPEIVEQKDEKIEDVLKHGLLHLLGYDHEVDDKAWEEVAERINCQL